MSPCPSLETLERGGDDVDGHLAHCPTCQSIADLMTVRLESAARFDDCARSEVLIAVGGEKPLSPQDALFLPVHLARCPSCREAALDPPAAEDLGLPSVAPDTYVLGAEIGRGGMGRVLAARDRRVGRAVALKEMLGKDAGASARFEREARITAQLQHPAIVSIYEVGRWPDGRPFYAMPILPGRTMREAIAAGRTVADRLRLLPNLVAAADAIAYAHSRGVIHRDLTPSNILVGSFGETTVIDWGVAKSLDRPEDLDPGLPHDPAGILRVEAGPGLTAIGTVIGTPAYISPEQAEGHAVDERADVYALGAILFQLLTGRPPYDGLDAASVIDRLRARRPPAFTADRHIPRDLLGVARKAMDGNVARRYRRAAEFVDDVRRFQTGDRIRAYAYSARELAQRWLARRLALVTTASVLLILVAVSTVAGGLRVLRERKRADDQTQALERMRDLLKQPTEASRAPGSSTPLRGWTAAGSSPKDYDMGVDRAAAWQGRPSAYLRSNKPETGGFGTLMQRFPADAYRGKRLRFSAHVRSENVTGWAGLWMRVDAKRANRGSLAFDNMAGRPVTGTSEWKRYEVVLDVAPEAGHIALGVLLNQTGAVWINRLKLEEVDQSVPTTNVEPEDVGKAPRNLDFSGTIDRSGLPSAWKAWSEGRGAYDMGVDRGRLHAGKATGYVRSRVNDSDGFGTLMQTLAADHYRGKWIRLSAQVRARGVADWAGLWMRVDAGRERIAFDNMQDRPIRGTTAWDRYEVVLPVDGDATSIAFGVLLSGRGEISMGDVSFEVVDEAAATDSRRYAPRNLELGE